MIFQSIENFVTKTDPNLLQKARDLKPELFYKRVDPKAVVNLKKEGPFGKTETLSHAALPTQVLKKGDRVVFDFGKHVTGRIHLKLKPVGSPADAPAFLRLKFAEMPCELLQSSNEYHGALSSSWIQEEFFHVDLLPSVIHPQRRYAFRYLEVEVLETSPKYQIQIEDLFALSESSANWDQVPELEGVDPDLLELDRISLETMHECMQDVFEDGPKRDRRLWIGDLRLQAQTNYLTFRNLDLVRRCLYLFGSLRHPDDHVAACLFVDPVEQADDTLLFDYALFFVSCLYDYYQASRDLETLQDLYPIAKKQIELALEQLDENDLLEDQDAWWCFLDWGEGLNKQAGAQAVLIYALRQMEKLAEILKDESMIQKTKKWIERTVQAARRNLWDENEGFFVSGKERQISWASQIWMVLAGVLDPQENRVLLKRLLDKDPGFRPATPYMMHHLCEALFQSGLKEQAVDLLKSYWGGMIRDGADTFFEVYDPSDPQASPYGDKVIHSYCHAWSATPAYFIRKYL